MGTIKALSKGVKTMRAGLMPAIVNIIEADTDEIIRLNQEQLRAGKDSTGEDIQPGYANDEYAALKNQLNSGPNFGTPDLLLTGSFYKGFYVTAGYTGIFTIDSIDAKALQLEYKYSKYIYGLTPENKKAYATGTFYSKLKAYITGKTGLVFR